MSSGGIAQCLPRLWYRRQLALALVPLLPLSWLYRLLVRTRGSLYRRGVLRSFELPVPVVVVGNLTVGGSGKTPLVLWLAQQFAERGWRPGIISRGYGGMGETREVGKDSEAALVGDEPLLLARRSGAPVFVGRDRVAAGRALLAAHPECDVVISDDGLQHYRLRRDVEIAVFDGRGTGNSRLLPAGPLREPVGRAATVTAIVWNSAATRTMPQSFAGMAVPQFAMLLEGRRFYALRDAACHCLPEDLAGKPVYAIAGIGDPSRFFAQLDALKIRFEAHPFPDHFAYGADDLAFAGGGVLLMTEKDAVKCLALPLGDAWVLPVDARLEPGPGGETLLSTILEKLDGRAPA